jgi:Tfp pilus assembly protein PilF
MATLSGLFRQLVARAPAKPDLPGIGRLIEEGRLDDAEARLRALRALLADPYAQMLLARIRREQGRSEEATDILEGLLSDHGEIEPVRLELAVIAGAAGDLQAVRGHYEAALAVHPDSLALLNNLGQVLLELGEPDRALAHLERARALGDATPRVLRGLARAYADLGRYADAEREARAEMGVEPDRPGMHVRLAELLLEQGRLVEAWPRYEARLERPEFIWGVKGLPRWDGVRRCGRLRIIAEQGLGDTMLFARFVPQAAARVERVQLLARAPVARLLASSFAGGNVEISTDTPLPSDLDAHAHLLSLPHVLGLGARAATRERGYLRPDARLLDEWRARVAAHRGLRVGLMWRGNPANPLDARRSLPIDVAARLGAARDGIAWFNLQVDADPSHPQPRPFPMVDLPQADFADSAALIAALDLVVSVDSSVAHAAGAIGTPLWLIAQSPPGWRWEMGGRENPWYGDVRLFRPPSQRDWAPVVDAIAAALRERVAP